MVFVSVTRLRLRSWRYALSFIWQVYRTSRQAELSAGFLGGRVHRDAGLVFWTITAWESDAAMTAYRNSGAHQRVMPKLLNWCDEAAVAHWLQETTELPNWPIAHQRMLETGRLSKVNNPSPDQLAQKIMPPVVTDRFDRIMRPFRL